MALNRTHVAAYFAGTLSLVALTGCPGVTPAGTTPVAAPSAAGSSAPTASPSAIATATPTPAAGGSAAPGTPGSAAPSVAVSAPPASGKVVVVSGMVYDEKGATVEGATVTFKSLDAAVPYTATVQTTAGSYVVNNVPEGANLEVVVTKSGWTTRRRVQSFQQRATGEKNTLNFGYAAATSQVPQVTYRLLAAETALPDGAAYFISDYPEVAATTPEHDTKGLDPSKLAIKVTLSEPLDEDSQDAFDDAFHIVPANAQAAASFDDVAGRENEDNDATDDGAAGDRIASFTYTLNEGDTFLGSSRNRVKSMWNAAGTEVVYTFEGGNLMTGDSEPAEYQAVLFAGGEAIEDADGNPLGTDQTGDCNPNSNTNNSNNTNSSTIGAPGQLLFNVFKDPDLAITPRLLGYRLSHLGPNSNWAETHKTAVSLEFKEDEVDPKLTGVGLVEEEDDVRLVFSFSEPMAAFNGSGLGTVSDAVYHLANYSFMVGLKAGDLDGESLSGGIAYLSAVDLDGGQPALTAEREFSFVADASIGAYSSRAGQLDGPGKGKDLDAAQDATVTIEVDPDVPSNVNIWIRNGRAMFDGFRELKARVEGVTDPAGNSIGSNDADLNMAGAKI